MRAAWSRKNFILGFIGFYAHLSIAQNYPQESTLVSISKNTFLSTLIAKPLIVSRCEQYKKMNLIRDLTQSVFDPILQSNCEKVTSHLFSLLDIKTLSDANGYMGRALFSHKLIELIKSQRTYKILTQIVKQLKKVESESLKKFNLPQILTQPPLELSSTEALEFIAVLFQDINALQHIYFLEQHKIEQSWREDATESINLNLLKSIAGKFQILFYDFHSTGRNRHFKKYNFYPPTFFSLTEEQYQPAIYHFYVPAYLTYKLKLLNNDTYYSFIAPFALRVLYEQLFNQEVDLTNFKTYLVALGQYEPTINSSYKHVDLYLSLAGSYWALNKKPPYSYSEFAHSISNNLPKTLRLITKNL